MIRLRFRPPYDWEWLIEFLAVRATPGVEAVTADSYRRTVAFNGWKGTFEVRRPDGADYLALRAQFPSHGIRDHVVGRVRRIFDLDAEPEEIRDHLTKDPRLAPLVKANPGLRVPGAWDGFELAVRAILGQQVAVKAATTLAGRLAHRFGARSKNAPHGEPGVFFPSSARLSRADVSKLGLPKARARAIRNLAQAFSRDELSFDPTTDLETFVKEMTRVEGVGEWTAHYVAMRLGQRDAFPATDLGLLRGASSGSKGIQPKTLRRRAEKWRPFRAYAAVYLWKNYGARLERRRGKRR
jgi:AraC family transcriptional regulator of adaptative response / DNA-3-methyladenine glycosylase II